MKRMIAALSTTILASSLFAGLASASSVDVKKYSVGVNSDLFAQSHESVGFNERNYKFT